MKMFVSKMLQRETSTCFLRVWLFLSYRNSLTYAVKPGPVLFRVLGDRFLMRFFSMIIFFSYTFVDVKSCAKPFVLMWC